MIFSKRISLNREPIDTKEYEANRGPRIQPETQLTLNGLYSALVKSNDQKVFELVGRVVARHERQQRIYRLGFTLLDDDFQVGPTLKLQSRRGIWVPYRTILKVGGNRIHEGYFRKYSDPQDELPELDDPKAKSRPLVKV